MTYKDELRPIDFQQKEPGAAPFPELVYRFRPLNTEYTFEELRRAVKDNAFRFSSLESFNDPFESSPRYVGSKPKDVKEYILNFKSNVSGQFDVFGNPIEIVAQKYDVTERKAKKLIQPTILGANKYLEEIKKWHNYIVTDNLALSASISWDSILMWSHYTNSHNGICMELEVDSDLMHMFGRSLEPMQYTDERPHIDTIELMKYASMPIATDYPDFFNMEELFATGRRLSTTKSEAWRYEGEERIIIKSPDGPGYYEVKSLSVKSILLGVNLDTDARKKIRQEFSDFCKVEDLVLHASKYELVRVPNEN
ncbi:MAG: DUF2971 domain-containing protein [Litoreibacter sp.]|nr:DUF2971 domain-containing protein [Litoreibacter sp.]